MRQIYLKYEITPPPAREHSLLRWLWACMQKGLLASLRANPETAYCFTSEATMSCMAPWLITKKGPGGRSWATVGCAAWGHTLVAHNAHFYDRFITRRPRPDNARPAGARFNFLLGSSRPRWHGRHFVPAPPHCSCVTRADIPITIIACFDSLPLCHVND